jgi:NADH dehydrogenase
VSPVAIQQGRFVAAAIANLIEGRPRQTFRYRDKGSMATIGRSRAVAEIGRVRLGGFIAWLSWLSVHIFYLIDFRNRMLVLIDWAWSYFTYQRGSRLITGHRLDAGAPGARGGHGEGEAVRDVAPPPEPRATRPAGGRVALGDASKRPPGA